MKIHVLYHVPFEGLGSIKDWIVHKNHELTESHLYDNQPLPDAAHFDLLIIMGGPMGINDEDQFPWLRSEKRLILQAFHKQKAILGICLGAQMIAQALMDNLLEYFCQKLLVPLKCI